jgi:hypothetical protein
MKGVIARIEGKNVFIRPEQSHCFGCMNSACRKPELIAAENKNGFDLSIGQTVEALCAKNSLARQAFSALFPLFLGFLIGFLLTRLIFPAVSDDICAVAGAAGLFGAASIAYCVRKRTPPKEFFLIIKTYESAH